MKRRKTAANNRLAAVFIALFILLCVTIYILIYRDRIFGSLISPDTDPASGSDIESGDTGLPEDGPGNTDDTSSPVGDENEPELPVIENEPATEYINLYGEEYSTFPLSHNSEGFKFTEKLIEIARSEPPEAEDSKGATKYGEYFGHATAEWCTEFSVWCVIQAETALGLRYSDVYYPKTDYSGGCVDWYEERGLFFKRGTYVPRRGDFIIFDYDNDGVTDHTGMVTGVEYDEAEDKLYILTIEGNLPEDYPVGSIKERRLSSGWSKIYGYGTFLIPE